MPAYRTLEETIGQTPLVRLQRVPGAMVNLGTRPESGDAYPNHSNRMLVNEAALATGMTAGAIETWDRLDELLPELR